MATTIRAENVARLCVVLAALLASTNGFFVKAPFFQDWSEATRGVRIACWRAAIVALLVLPFVRRPRWDWKLLPMAIAFLVMNVAFLSSMVLTTAANTIWLQYTAPAWVFLGSALWLKDPITPGDRRLLAFAVSGAAIIIAFEADGQSLPGLALGLLSGIAYAAVMLFLRALRGMDPVWLAALNHGITAAVLLPWVIAWGAPPSGAQWLQLAGFSGFQMAIPFLLVAFSMRAIPGHEASAITLVEPLVVPLWVWWAWGGQQDYVPTAWWTWVGGGLILMGLVLRYAPEIFRARGPASTGSR
jgi:DME family drug/metabolite transporter